MSGLPSEIWTQILEYLEPEQILSLQRVSRELLRLARDSQLWKAKVFEKAPSAVHAFASGNGLSDLLNSLSLSGSAQSSSIGATAQSEFQPSRRARAIAKWDCTDKTEQVDWYSEYMSRHAPLSTEWQHHESGNEIRSAFLFGNEKKVLSAMEDGSLRIWDVKTAANSRRSLLESSRSSPGTLFDDMSTAGGPSSSRRPPYVGSAIDSTLVQASNDKAYIAVREILNEVDLQTMTVVSQQKFAWKITAISQQSGPDLPLMVGTSYTLNMHDPRIPLRIQSGQADDKTDHDQDHDDARTVFLPNYAKRWFGNQPHPARPRHMLRPTSLLPNSYAPVPIRPGTISTAPARPRADPEIFAQVDPGPQTILHRGPNEIVVAGRMPSILFYDKRTFPQLQSVIHSGARLSSLTTLAYAPHRSNNPSAESTLIAAGEYHGRGSLELYELPFNRPSDRQATYNWPPEEQQPNSNPDTDTDSDIAGLADPNQEPALTPQTASSSSMIEIDDPPYSHKNRQTSSSAKLLSVATQGARIVFSDSEGGLKWVERDGIGLARRWNINSYEYSHAGGAVVGDAVARKIITFPSDATYSNGDNRAGMTRGDGDLLIWTGSDLGIVTSKVKWTGHDELVAAFEDQMTLEDSESSEGKARKSLEEDRTREEEYAKTMRRALERQADERRFLARFGRMGSGW